MNKVEKHFVLIFWGVRWYIDPSIYEKGLNNNLNGDQSGSVISQEARTLYVDLADIVFFSFASGE